MVILMLPTYKNLLDLGWLNGFLYSWVLKWQLSANRFLNHWVLTRAFLQYRFLANRMLCVSEKVDIPFPLCMTQVFIRSFKTLFTRLV